MRAIFLLAALICLLATGCSIVDPGTIEANGPKIGNIPPQTESEPRTVLLSEMIKKLGWRKAEAWGVRNHAMENGRGDRITFTEDSDLLTINNIYWRMERDAVAKPGDDLLLPESVFDFVARRFGRSDLVRKKSAAKYELEPLTPATEAKKPEKAVGAALAGWTVCIDAGHGGKDPGAIANGVTEKEVCLAVALRLQKLCEAAGAKVHMTRTTDTYPDLDARCELANSKRCDLFISIHCNIAPNSDDVSGCEAYYSDESESSRRLAVAIVHAVVTQTGVADRGARKDTRGLRVLTKTAMPATLVELGFLSNPAEARKLNSPAMQDKMAKALFDGLVNYTSRERKAVVSR